MKIYKSIALLFFLLAIVTLPSTKGWGQKTKDAKLEESIFVKITPKVASAKKEEQQLKEEEQKFKKAVSKNLVNLAKEFDNQDIPEDAKTGGGLLPNVCLSPLLLF